MRHGDNPADGTSKQSPYREVEAQAEAERWLEAAADEAFRDEAAQIARTFEAMEVWPD